ncbi:MAG: LPS export ABC transporter permease LptG [Candidatus Brocadiaceae bacterium]|nr:LPS export ABC transporter permease LptG [Candidatus Brocadiaceae bacterium]
MIINRYILRQIHQGTVLALLAIVSLSLIFVFIAELDDVGRGYYSLLHVVEYTGLLLPGKIVEFMPLAAMLGTILSLGSLASNSEIIAMQAAGVSVSQLIVAVLQAAVILALVSFLVADWVAPLSETAALQTRSSAINKTTSIRGRKGIWIKDENSVLHIDLLLPNGIARDIEVHRLDDTGRLISTTTAESAIPDGNRWRLKRVKQTLIGESGVSVRKQDEMIYHGKISGELLKALMIEPRQMSSPDLYTYIDFLQQNNLQADLERLTFWKKLFSPLVVIVMCILAIPFVVGSQRQGNAGQRLMMGIILGLSYVVADRLLTQLGSHLNLFPVVSALLPTLLFLLLAIHLLFRKI